MSYYANSPKSKNNKYVQTPDLVLDLHGFTTIESKVELDEVVGKGDYSYIRIIVGKGLNSENGPVLPEFVRNYLSAKGIRFNQSKIEDGGEGALDVFL